MTNKRRRLSAKDRKRLIVHAAIELFAQRGFRDTRVVDIAEKVGTSDALVFQHFPTKRDLYDAILDEMCARRHFTEIEELLYYSDGYDLADVLTRLSAWVLDQTEREPAWLRLILYAALEQSDAAPQLLEEHFRRIVDYVAFEIAEAQATGRFRAGDAQRYAREFFAGLLGLATMRTIARDTAFRADDIRAAAATHVSVFLGGVAGSEGGKAFTSLPIVQPLNRGADV
jgi:AcrR family transcriptional regulator